MGHVTRDWAERQRVGSLSAKAILSYLAKRSDDAHQCFPGTDTIADDCEMSVRAAKAGLDLLEALNLISRERRYNGYQKRSSDLYTLRVDVEVRQPKKAGAPRGKSAASSVDSDASPVPMGADSAPIEDSTTAPSNAAEFAPNEPKVVPKASSGATSALPSGANFAADFAESAPALMDEPSDEPLSRSSSLPEVTPEGDGISNHSEDPADSLYLGLSMIDDDDFDADAVTDRILRGLHPTLSREALVNRLRQGGTVDVDQVNLTVAALTIWERRKGGIGDPVAYIASSIEKDPTNEAWMRHYASDGTPRASSGGALTADRVCAVHGHQWAGNFQEICARCGEERPGWRDDRDAAEQHNIIPQGATR